MVMKKDLHRDLPRRIWLGAFLLPPARPGNLAQGGKGLKGGKRQAKSKKKGLRRGGAVASTRGLEGLRVPLKTQPPFFFLPPAQATWGGAGGAKDSKRLVFYCRTTIASTAPCTSRRMCCSTHCACDCAPSQSLFRVFPGWIRCFFFLLPAHVSWRGGGGAYRGASPIRNRAPLGAYSRTLPRGGCCS